jgi:lysophospholipase L1-like esterase
VLFGLLLCEGAVRLRAWILYGTTAPVVSSLLVEDPATGLVVPRAGADVRGRKVQIHVDSLGFRGPEIPREKPPGTVRIACLGASTTFCGEVSSDEKTWPAQLERLLCARFPDVPIEVVNAGVPGYRISQTLASFRRRVLPLQPDLVIDYEANNDMARDTEELARARGLLGDAGAAAGWLDRHSLLVNLVHKNLEVRAKASSAGKLASLPPELTRSFAAELSALEDEAERAGVPLVVGTFLVKYRRGQPREVQLANADVAFYYMPWMTVDLLLDGIDAYNAAIRDVARARGIVLADDPDAVPADADHYADCMHFTDAGCERLARRFERVIARRRVLDAIVAAARRAK